MATKREKKVILPTTITLEQANDAFQDYSTATTRQKEINDRKELEIKAINERYETELDGLEEKKTEAFEVLQTYATNNRDDFGKKKSLSLLYGIIGFRTGTPKLKTKRGYTWESALALLRVHLKGYVVTAAAVDKKKLLADRDLELVKKNLDACGIMVDQDESFYVEAFAGKAVAA